MFVTTASQVITRSLRTATAAASVSIMPDELRLFIKRLCIADGSSKEEALLVSEHLVMANLTGHDSHGAGMMRQYITNTGSGACVRNQHAVVAKDNGAILVVEGGGGYGQVIAKEAMDVGIKRAKEHGVCVLGLINSHHVGRIGHWGEQCARSGLVSTHWVNVHGHKSLVSPFGGVESRMGTNPYCTVIPRHGKPPLVLDFATSEVALGKVRVALNQEEQMASGMLIDARGTPTTDPATMYREPYGAILPFGLHKGAGLAVVCDLLAGALTGGKTHAPHTIVEGSNNIVNNMLSLIIDPAAMGSKDDFDAEVEDFIGWVKSSTPQPGVASVLIPGEPEEHKRKERETNGIVIDATSWQQLVETAEDVGLDNSEIPSLLPQALN
eukprot:gene8653-31634_t